MRGDIVPPARPDNPQTWPTTVSSRQDQAPAAQTVADQPAPVPEPTPSSVDPAIIDQVKLDEPRPDRPKPRFSKRWLAVLTGFVMSGLLIVIVAAGWYFQQLAAVDSSSTEKIKVVIEPGTDLGSIASSLKENGLIRDSTAFGLYVRLNGKGAALQSGSYRLSPAEDVRMIVGHLTSGKTDTFSITFLPGATLAKHRQALIDTGYQPEQVDAALNKTYDHPALVSKPASADLEGYIYGETYNFPAEATPEEIVVRALDQFQSVIVKNGLTQAYEKQGFTLYEGITMASIIQREVVTAEDAAQVAQVFKLRYDRGMQLGSDVTYQYIADKTGQARSVDLDSPYNTRRYAGLPPGPISSPGEAALKAVAKPAPGDYVYFLSGDDDKTYFARTNEEHERNIREHCQKKCQII